MEKGDGAAEGDNPAILERSSGLSGVVRGRGFNSYNIELRQSAVIRRVIYEGDGASLRSFAARHESYLRPPKSVVRKNAVAVEDFGCSVPHPGADRDGYEVRFAVQNDFAIDDNRLVV